MIYCMIETPGSEKVSGKDAAIYAGIGNAPPNIAFGGAHKLLPFEEIQRMSRDGSLLGQMIELQRVFKRIAISYRTEGRNRWTGLPEFVPDRAFYVEYP